MLCAYMFNQALAIRVRLQAYATAYKRLEWHMRDAMLLCVLYAIGIRYDLATLQAHYLTATYLFEMQCDHFVEIVVLYQMTSPHLLVAKLLATLWTNVIDAAFAKVNSAATAAALLVVPHVIVRVILVVKFICSSAGGGTIRRIIGKLLSAAFDIMLNVQVPPNVFLCGEGVIAHFAAQIIHVIQMSEFV